MSRITFSTMYNTSMRGLQYNANKLNKLHEQVISEKKINRPSDDAVGFTNVVRYRNIINQLGQQQINMNDGEAYMTVMENTFASMNNVFLRSRDLAVQAANDTEKHEDRLFANLEVRQMLEQLVADSQTKHKDNYIFSGKWTDQPPYEIKKAEVNFDPLNGTHPNQNLNKNFYDENNDPITISLNPIQPPPPPTIDDPNDPTIPPAQIPNPALLTYTIFNSGEKVEIQLFDNAYMDPNLKPGPENPLVQRIIPGSLELLGYDLMEKPNTYSKLYGDLDPSDPNYIDPADPRYLDPDHPDYNKPDYEIDYAEGKIILLSDRAKLAFYNENGMPKNPTDPIYDPNDPAYDPDQIFSPPPSLSFEYIYRNSLDMSGDIYREVDTDITIKINSNRDPLFGKGSEGETDSFKEIISLMQGLWYNEQEEIAKSIDNLEVSRKRNLAEETVSGTRLNRVAMVFDRNMGLTTSNTKAMSNIESVSLDDIIPKWVLADAVYSASLNVTSKMLQNSLVNFL